MLHRRFKATKKTCFRVLIKYGSGTKINLETTWLPAASPALLYGDETAFTRTTIMKLIQVELHAWVHL